MKAFKAFIKPFEAPKRNVKIKIELNFFSLSGIRTGRVKTLLSENIQSIVSRYNLYVFSKK